MRYGMALQCLHHVWVGWGAGTHLAHQCPRSLLRRPCRSFSRLRLRGAVLEQPMHAHSPPQPPDGEACAGSARPAYRAHIDFRFIKNNLDLVRRNARARNSAADADAVVALYDTWVALLEQVESTRAERNANAKAMKGKLEAEERTELVQAGRVLKEKLASMEAAAEAAEDALQREAQKLSNLSHPQAPVGGEEAARLLKEVGTRRELGFEPRDHLAIAAQLDLIDFETGAAVAGAKFVYLRRAAALLEMALCNWALQSVAAAGFLPMTTPDLVRESVLEMCGFQPRAENTQVYSVRGMPLCLTGTAEVPLGAVYLDRIIPEDQLPIRLAAFGHCFRTEAGSAGSASRGLYRVHQFSKVEMFVLCTPAQSEAMLQELCELEEHLFTQLGLHFRMLDMPTGDLGAPAHRKIDIEAWMPGLQRYGEISSASNCTDYQARRLNIRYRPRVEGSQEDGSMRKAPRKMPTNFVHTLNATACAVPRMIVAILETFQQEDGSVLVPGVLRPYLGGLERIGPPS